MMIRTFIILIGATGVLTSVMILYNLGVNTDPLGWVIYVGWLAMPHFVFVMVSRALRKEGKYVLDSYTIGNIVGGFSIAVYGLHILSLMINSSDAQSGLTLLFFPVYLLPVYVVSTVVGTVLLKLFVWHMKRSVK
jgi:hypothetical protein